MHIIPILHKTLRRCALMGLVVMGLASCSTARAEVSPEARQLVRQAAEAAVQRDYRRSSDLLYRARRQAEQATDYEQLFWVYTNLGINQAELLNYADALLYFTQASQIAREHLDNRRALSIRNNIAGLYMLNGEKEKALAEYRKVYRGARQVRDSVLTGGTALNMALLLLDFHRYAEMVPYMEEAERLLGRDEANKVALVSLRANYLIETHHAEAAYALVQRVRSRGRRWAQDVELLYVLSRASQATDSLSDAIAYASEALQSKGADLTMKRAIFELLSQLYTSQHDFPSALRCKDSVTAVADSLSAITGQKIYEARQIQFDNWQKQQEIDNYQTRHRLELALLVVGFLAVIVLIWALLSQKKAARQQRLLASMELEREQERREQLQRRVAEEKSAMEAEQAESQRTIEQRGRELMSKALQAANRNDALRDVIHALEQTTEVSASHNPALRRSIAALRHQLDSSVEWRDFTTYFEQSNAHFVGELKRRHPSLTANEVRYLSLVFINLSAKEIALLLNITPEYCKKKKQQVARKMGLTDPRELYAYLAGMAE